MLACCLLFWIFVLTACGSAEVKNNPPASSNAAASTGINTKTAAPTPTNTPGATSTTAETEIPPPTPTGTPTTAPTAADTEIPSPAPTLPAPEGARAAAQLPDGLLPVQCQNAGLPESACSGATINADWEPYIREFNQVEMALVPAGCFQMGSDEGYPDVRPAHIICFREPFWIDRTEVTVGQFARFMNGQP